MIQDQRHIFATAARGLHERDKLASPVLGEPGAVEEFWEAYAGEREEAGLPRYPLAPTRTETADSATVLTAYVSDGRWVADCAGGPHGSCHGGLACWPDHESACCLDCGTVYPIAFPDSAEIAEATATLMGRPQANRNWRPGEETPKDLREENIIHGAPPEQTWQQRLAEEHNVSPETVELIVKGSRKRRT